MLGRVMFFVVACVVVFTAMIAVAIIAANKTAHPRRETHGPVQIIVTNPEDGFALMPDVMHDNVSVYVVSSFDGGQVECRAVR